MKRSFPIDACLRISLAVLVVAIVADLTNILLFSSAHDSTFVYAARRVPHQGVGSSQSSAEAFFTSVSLELDGVKLIDFLNRYSETYGFAFFLDRRVDPTTTVSCSLSDVPLIDVFDAICLTSHLSFCVVDGALVYIGPEESGADLQLLFQIKRSEFELNAVPKPVAIKLESLIDFEIFPFSEPREIFQMLAKRAQVKLVGFDNLPFDRWRHAYFENVRVANLLSILAIGFNAEYQYDPATNALKATPLDRDCIKTLVYDSQLTSKLKRSQFPNCSFQDDGDKVIITGKFADLSPLEIEASLARRERIENAMKLEKSQDNSKTRDKKTSSRSSSRNGKTLVSGSVVNKTLRDLFAYLEKNSNIHCQLDPSLEADGVTLDERITCDFKNADVRKIGTTIASKIGARAQIDGNTITFISK